MFAIKKSSPLLPRICQGPKKSLGSEQEEFLSIFKGATYLSYPAREFIYAPSYPYRKLTKILTSEGHIFDHELTFYLLEVSCPIFYFVLKTISINKEFLEVHKHKCAYLYPDLGTNNGHKRQKT